MASGRQRAVKDPFWATALNRMQANGQRFTRGLHSLVQRSPQLQGIVWMGSGWRSNSTEHNSGRALDVMFVANGGTRPNADERRARDLLVAWLVANGNRLGIQWILVSRDGKARTESFNFDRGTWKALANRGSISANHVDHIHVYLKSGAAGWREEFDHVSIGAAPAPAPGSTSVRDLALDVLAGKYGNGEERKRRLGARYAEVQREVNRIIAEGSNKAIPPLPKPVQGQRGDHFPLLYKADGHPVTSSRGNRVRTLQAGLRRFFPAYRNWVRVQNGSLLDVDGLYGRQTEAWVREFQKRTNLRADGIVGDRTVAKLRAAGIRL